MMKKEGRCRKDTGKGWGEWMGGHMLKIRSLMVIGPRAGVRGLLVRRERETR